MKTSLLILVLALMGCRTAAPPVYFAEKPHYQTNARHPSNLFPDPQHRDSYMWYQGNTSRNVRLGGDAESSSQSEGSSPQAESFDSSRGFGGFGYGGYGPPPVFYQPGIRFPVFY
jgi:hypothetical protein